MSDSKRKAESSFRVRFERMARLLESCRDFSSTLVLEQSLSLALAAAERLVGSERSSIWRLDEEQGDLRFVVMRGAGGHVEKELRKIRMRLGEGIVGWVALNGKPLVIDDTQSDPRWSHKVDDKSGFVTRSILSVPLRAPGRVIGVLQLLNKTGGHHFDKDDLFLMESMSSQIAIAMENATLYQKVRTYNEQLREKVRELELEILERKRLEAERREFEEQLRQAQKIESIGQVAGGIAHDFNNLLTPIKGYAQLALMRIGDTQRVSRALRQVFEAGERAQSLTRQILAFSRRQPLEVRMLSLTEIVRDFDAMLRRLIRADVQIEMRLAEPLGGVRGDASQIEQIILNLAVNARDAMPNGGKLTIETADILLDRSFVESHAGAQSGPHVVLSVTDTGCGIDAATMHRIFEPFFTTKRRGEGTGLGLATVYGVVKQHGGYVEVDSAPGQGTTFRVYLPRAEEAPAVPGSVSELAETMRGTETILLAEDNELVRDLAREVLEEHGYTVLVASDSRAALALARSHAGTIDLLLTDLIMPHVNGRELHERLAAERPGLKALFMSGYTDSVIAPLGALDPGRSLLRKPFTVEELTAKIRETLEGSDT